MEQLQQLYPNAEIQTLSDTTLCLVFNGDVTVFNLIKVEEYGIAGIALKGTTLTVILYKRS